MAGPAHPFCLVLFAAVLGPIASAQTTPSSPAPAAPASSAPVEPAPSPKLQRLFPDNVPAYRPPPEKPRPAAPATATDVPRNTILRLPPFIVRGGARLPDQYEILTEKGHDAAMAKRYLGPQGTLDRALNGVTLTDLWKSIPLLGKVPFMPFASRTYDQRAALIYDIPEKKRRFEELMSIERAAQAAGKPAVPAPAAATK